MSDFAGTRIALLEARQGSDLVRLVRRKGGMPIWVPAVKELKVASGLEVSAFLDALTRGECPVVVFQTGAGVNLLMQEAEQLGRLKELVEALKGITTVARGPKPGAALSQQGLRASIGTRPPYTTADLLEAMAVLPLEDTCVALINYGERNEALCGELRHRGAQLKELQLYEWTMPDGVERLRQLVHELLDGVVDAIAFTSQIQARHLFRVAEDMGLATALARALNTRIVVASVGPTCTAALQELGVTPHVAPERPKMGPMVTALGEYLRCRPARSSALANPSGGRSCQTGVRSLN